MSYVQPSNVVHPLVQHKDSRGSFTEVSNNSNFGQWSLNEILPHRTKGNHYHRIRFEKFILLSGVVKLLWRYPFESSWQEINLNQPYHALDIPPGVVHQLINIQSQPATFLMWSSIVYDSEFPDTYVLPL